jgi:uncharacterized protein YoxC
LEKDSQIEKSWRYVLIAAIALIVLLLFFIFNRYMIKQKANVALSQKNEAIERQNRLIEKQRDELSDKNKAIVDSIHYAKRIQQSLLPTNKYIEKNLKRLNNKKA